MYHSPPKMVVEEVMAATSNDEEIGDNIGLGRSLEVFTEWKEVLSIIDNITVIHSGNNFLGDSESCTENFKCILDRYIDQPHLLDPYLDQMLSKIVSIARQTDVAKEAKNLGFRYLRIISNVRGFKVVVNHLPHEVSDLEPVLQLLEAQDESDVNTWETRHSLLQWLCIIVMIPFHMSRLDNFRGGDAQHSTVVDRLLVVCKRYLMVRDNSQRAAACLTARFITRSDVKEHHLAPFLDWACQGISDRASEWDRFGPLFAVAAILKHGKREDLLPHASSLLECIIDAKCRHDKFRLTRKYAIKIVQRIGMTYMRVRVASWRYQRGCRSLAANLCAAGDNDVVRAKVEELGGDDGSHEWEGSEGEEQEIAVQVEEVIDQLIQGLSDEDIENRWSAAKGVGRITGRLNRDLGDEIVGTVLDLLNLRESDAAWHGACLALAELGKRGLLMPSRLPNVVPLVVTALTYEEVRGQMTIGSHIRDAACYVIWAFARAYDVLVLRPYITDIASALLVVACFDREINCRRAASAAFQENVGRQGTIPHGIEIITTADYFAVGVRNNAYLNISMSIAQYEEYKLPLIKHLVERKVDHWDVAIRELSAKALHNLTPFAPDYLSDTGMRQLLKQISSININARHGAITAIGEVLHALAKMNYPVADDIVAEVCGIVRTLRTRLQLRGVCSEIMKISCCHLIEKCCLSQLAYSDQTVIDDWQGLVDECLSNEVEGIRTRAVLALAALCNQYYQRDGVVDAAKRDMIIDKYTNQLTSNYLMVRTGFALALGYLPSFMLSGQIETVVRTLIRSSTITPETLNWAESRRNALRALTNIVSTLGVHEQNGANISCRAYVEEMLECFLTCLDEYTLDSRGDIGAWVREAAMTGIQVLVLCVAKSDANLLTPDLVGRSMAGVSKQAVERIDRVRAHAGKVFCSLLHSKPAVSHIPDHEHLLTIFLEDECASSILWNSASETFPRFVRLIPLPAYTNAVIAGLILSVGGVSESLKCEPAELERLCSVMTDAFARYQGVDRVSLPFLMFADRLLSSNTLMPILNDSPFPNRLLALTKAEISRSSNTHKLLASADVFCQLVQVRGKVSQSALSQLSIFLCHKFEWLRKAVAGKLYEALSLYGDDIEVGEEELEGAMVLLSDTDWADWPIDRVREARNELCHKLGVPHPRKIAIKAK